MNYKLIIILLISLFFVVYFVKCGSKEGFESNDIISNDVPSYELSSSINQDIVSNQLNKTIPKIIIQTWKDNNIPERYSKHIESVKKINPDYNYIFFTDDDIENFLKKYYPDYYQTYQKLPIKIQKIDFFRYIAVYHFGGFYMDLDMTSLTSFNPLLKNECVFPKEQYISEQSCNDFRFKDFCEKKIDFVLGQYAFGASPKNSFIKKLCDNIHSNIDFYISSSNDTNYYVYKTTGPDYVTDVYLDFPNKNELFLLDSVDKRGQMFGVYAAHNFFGTWK